MKKYYIVARASFLFISLSIFILSNSACSTTGVLKGNIFEKKNNKYNIGLPGENWTQLRLKGADLAWINKNKNATILVNSQCQNFKDTPLSALTVQLLLGLTEQNIISQEKKPWSNREALETVLTAKIDGVLRKFNIFVLKKDGCVYDIVFSASTHSYDLEVDAFNQVRDQFNAQGNQ